MFWVSRYELTQARPRTGLGQVTPIVCSRLHVRREHRDRLDSGLYLAGFDQQHIPMWIFRESVGQHATAGARSHNYLDERKIIVVAMNCQ